MFVDEVKETMVDYLYGMRNTHSLDFIFFISGLSRDSLRPRLMGLGSGFAAPRSGLCRVAFRFNLSRKTKD
jgi:hypothetical protein